MDSPITSPANGTSSRVSSTSTGLPPFFHSESYIPMSSLHHQLRRSSRASASRRSGPVDFLSTSTTVAHTRVTAGGTRTSSRLESLENPKVAPGSTSVNRSSSRTRKRRHHGAENPDGPELTSSYSSSAKHRRTARASSQKRLKKSPPSSLKAPPPSAKSSSDEEIGDQKPAATAEISENCCICMGDVEPDDLAQINGCDHSFCFGCIEKWAERENTCPLCKCRFTKIDRINKKRKKGAKNSKKVKQRDQRSDLLPGAAIEGLLGKYLLLRRDLT